MRGPVNTMRIPLIGSLAILALAAGAGPAAAQGGGKPVTLLNVSYDPTRELYEDFNVSRTAARASRPARSSTGWRPTW